MIKKLKNSKETTYENLHNGKGLVCISTLLDKKDKVRGLDMFAEVKISVGASIGYHIHNSDSEAYYITEGSGIFYDNQKEKKPISRGDLCLITQNQGHGIINTGSEPLTMVAIVWSTKDKNIVD